MKPRGACQKSVSENPDEIDSHVTVEAKTDPRSWVARGGVPSPTKIGSRDSASSDPSGTRNLTDDETPGAGSVDRSIGGSYLVRNETDVTRVSSA